MGKDTCRDCSGVILNIFLIMKHLVMLLYLIAPTKQIGTTYPLFLLLEQITITAREYRVICVAAETFTKDNVQKYPISVITDGDLAMQRAISVVWPNSPHRLCG